MNSRVKGVVILLNVSGKTIQRGKNVLRKEACSGVFPRRVAGLFRGEGG